jgi:hypothetical protein
MNAFPNVLLRILILNKIFLRIFTNKKLGRMRENFSNGYNMKKHKKRPTYNDLIIAYASKYKARINYFYTIYR